MEVRKREFGNFILLEISLEGPITPEQLPDLLKEVEKNLSPSDFQRGIIISGRLPIWAHSSIAHECHPAKWVAHFDPRIGGGVVVQSHDPNIKVGQVIPVPQ